MDTGVEYGHPAFGGRVTERRLLLDRSDCPNGGTSQIGGNAGIPCTFAQVPVTTGRTSPASPPGAALSPGVADQAKIESIRVFHQARAAGSPCPLASDSDILAA